MAVQPAANALESDLFLHLTKQAFWHGNISPSSGREKTLSLQRQRDDIVFVPPLYRGVLLRDQGGDFDLKRCRMQVASLIRAVLLLMAVLAPMVVAESPTSGAEYMPANPFSQQTTRITDNEESVAVLAPKESRMAAKGSEPSSMRTLDSPNNIVQQSRGREHSGQRQYRPSSGYTLPAGRRYYNGRYFGNFNNRFYGPQYGYF